ncbi:ELYS protein, partial [Haliaeetus albicilla]|nr:ELYS protein [Haliaeetus albicilla]
RLLDLVVRPVPSTSAAQGGSWQSPCGASTSFTASSPLKSNMLGCTSQKNFSRASELNLLETPLVVKVCVLKNRINQPNQKPVNFGKFSSKLTAVRTLSHSFVKCFVPCNKNECKLKIGLLSTHRSLEMQFVTEDNKAPSGVSSEHHHGAVEDAWSESRDKPTLFPLSNPEEGGAEVEESGDGLEKTDVSKENSNFSARSDQAALEYHDAK